MAIVIDSIETLSTPFVIQASFDILHPHLINYLKKMSMKREQIVLAIQENGLIHNYPERIIMLKAINFIKYLIPANKLKKEPDTYLEEKKYLDDIQKRIWEKIKQRS